MPAGNRKGPLGQGPATGRGMGGCGAPDARDDAQARGAGFGRGWRAVRGGGGGRQQTNDRGAAAPDGGQPAGQDDQETPGSRATSVSRQQELRSLRQQAENLEKVVTELRAWMAQLETAAGGER